MEFTVVYPNTSYNMHAISLRENPHYVFSVVYYLSFARGLCFNLSGVFEWPIFCKASIKFNIRIKSL